jgi:hypothetical protein
VFISSYILLSRRENRVSGIQLTSFIWLQRVYTMSNSMPIATLSRKRTSAMRDAAVLKTPEKERTGAPPVCPPAPTKPKRAPYPVRLRFEALRLQFGAVRRQLESMRCAELERARLVERVREMIRGKMRAAQRKDMDLRCWLLNRQTLDKVL